MKSFPSLIVCCLITTGLAVNPCLAEDGVDVGKPSALRKLVPATQLEQQAAQQYARLKRQAAEKGALAADDESEANLVGLDLVARAGFDPRAGVSLWQKMGAANRGAVTSHMPPFPSPCRVAVFFNGIEQQAQ
ncbi:hypothetical protein [Rhodocyclus purpureus]|uniref:hypothetical protein n=1 Tax=Rhodocyclus purpureus TaxID=1067 RepID=UPI0019135914|nr:hypothetical protein [Rhodocyclus purpureus]MBK5914219.1 hypothetical protein [Rhodocyclus purpureus]